MHREWFLVQFCLSNRVLRAPFLSRRKRQHVRARFNNAGVSFQAGVVATHPRLGIVPLCAKHLHFNQILGGPALGECIHAFRTATHNDIGPRILIQPLFQLLLEQIHVGEVSRPHNSQFG